MFIKWLTPARQDIAALVEWYTHNAPEHLASVAQRIWDASLSLQTLPIRGRAGFVEGTRELLIPQSPYMLVYVIQGSEVVIVRLLHQHQRWPEV